VFLAYNMRRAVKILGTADKLKRLLPASTCHFALVAMCGAREPEFGFGNLRRGVALEGGSYGKGRCAGVGKGDFFHNLHSMQLKYYE